MKKLSAFPLVLTLVAAGMAVALIWGPERQLAAPPPPSASLINGAGATFPYPIYSKWFDEYHKLHPDIQINYQSIGSGGAFAAHGGNRRFRCD